MQFIILSIILLITIQKCYGFERLYVNFVPYQTDDCSGEVSGIGYTGVIDTCLTFDDRTNFQFEVSDDGNVVNWSTYKATNFGATVPTPCHPNVMLSNNTDKSGACVPNSLLNNINQGYIPMNSFYYQVTVSKVAYIPPNSFSDVYMAGDYGECANEDIVVAAFLTNGTVSQLTGYIERYVYLCIDDSPYVSECKTFKNNPNKCSAPLNATLDCYQTNSFYNGSSFEPPTALSSTTGLSTSSINSGSGTGSGSGSGSGSSNGAASGSASTSGSSSAGFQDFNGDFQSSSSSSFTYYYHSTFCTKQ